jgi:peptidoglycan/LPS O-acetylase OafA/YrhL
VSSTSPTTPPAPATGGAKLRARIIGLDGVRGLLCLSIAITHVTTHYTPNTAQTWMTGLLGFSLVYFFVLSGFLLFLPYVRNLVVDRASAKMPGVRDYALHRIARIMPCYLVIFLLVNYVFQIAYVQNPAVQPLGTTDGTGMITDPGMLLANLTLTQTYFPAYIQTGINPAWSLTLEYAFYASLPVFGMILFALRKRINLNPFVLAALAPALLFVVGIVGRTLIPVVFAHVGTTDFMLLNWGPNWGAVFTKSFLTNADNFALGMFAAVIFVAIERGALREGLSRRIRMLSALAIPPMLVVSALLLAMEDKQFVTAGVAVVAALMILVIVAPLARGEKTKLAVWLDSRPIRYVGEISLSAYLWHFPAMLMLDRLGLMAGDTAAGMWRNVALLLTVTIAIASVTYYAVEKPVMKWVKRRRAKQIAAPQQNLVPEPAPSAP